MQCPSCAHDEDKVIDSRSADNGRAIRRRRHCLACDRRFTTFERLEEANLQVVKRSGDRVPFDVEKIVSGVRAACKNRDVNEQAIVELATTIEDRARVDGVDAIASEQIGREVLDALSVLDQVAYLRFASVYKVFEDPADFTREVGLLPKVTSPKRH